MLLRNRSRALKRLQTLHLHAFILEAFDDRSNFASLHTIWLDHDVRAFVWESSGNNFSCVTRPMTATTMMRLNTVLLPLVVVVVVVVSLRGRERERGDVVSSAGRGGGGGGGGVRHHRREHRLRLFF